MELTNVNLLCVIATFYLCDQDRCEFTKSLSCLISFLFLFNFPARISNTNKMGFLFGILCALCHLVLAQTQHVGMFGLINMLYLKADKDLNGVITPAELDSVYNGFDLNKDGKVTSQEFVPLWESITGFPHEMASAYFFLADLNADGVVDNKDLTILYGRFDIDGNGHVSAEEFNKKWQSIYRESPLAVLFERADADKNEHLDSHEFTNLFESFDANNDHVISKHEFEHGWTTSLFGNTHDADVFFRHLDANHNNHLNVHEVHNLFTHYDANHNHQITIIELVKKRKRGSDSPELASGSATDGRYNGQAKYLYILVIDINRIQHLA